ncbi:poly(ethylene terephthalate) hydrolase family protein [Amycolatopsis sacchari]|uniref:poly(ethylene terephthalate) hydrolase family protein n=1 Tax=Amycolatopsis sacchari TaxID=115433 RepID=UPI003EC09ACF
MRRTLLPGLLLPVLLAGAGLAPAQAAQPWSVTPVAGGYQVTLRLPDQLEARDALPELAVDGNSVGVARQSPDGRTLTVVTEDPAAAHPSSVQLAWNGQVAGTERSGPAHGTKPRPGNPVPADPSAPGRYAVSRADYDFGDSALTLPGLGNRVVEERAAVWVPSAPGPRPVVLFLHGRHSACYNPATRATDNTHWPCVEGFQPIPSYRGYDQSAQVLASHGYVVVSISADGVNAQDNPYSEDAGTTARGQLVLDHLDLLAQADSGRAKGMSPLLRGKLDLSDVGLMGHSRGGEGVVKAALLNAARPHPYGVRAVLPLAPIDFGRETLPDVPMAVVLPYCDGDVSNQQGQHFYDDSRYADPGDGVFRASVMVMGADHNFFNTEWTPGVAVAPANDDWGNQDDPTCGMNAPATTRLSAAEQYQVGVDYIAGFFRLVMGHETAFSPLFDGGTAKVGAATVLQETQAPRRLDVAPLQGPAANVSAPFGQYCASMAGRSPQSGLPSCTASTATARFPSFTPANYGPNVTATPLLHLSWTTPSSMSIAVPRSTMAGYDALTVRAALDDANAPADLTLTVVDGAGRSQSATLSSLGDALTPLPGSGTLLPKTWLRTVRWPLAQLKHVNTRDLRKIVISTASPSGGVFLSDVAFQTFAPGQGGPSRLPQVTISDSTVDEGAGSATMTVSLSERSREPVTVSVQALAGTGTQVVNSARQVVVPPGRLSVPVTIPVVGNTVAEANAATAYKVFVVSPVNAVVGQDFAHLTVRDDDQAATAALPG